MKTSAKWGIALGAGIPGALILIGLLAFFIKFLMKRCRKKPWHDIRTTPKQLPFSHNINKDYNKSRPKSPERQPLCVPSANNTLDTSDAHTSIPIDENDPYAAQRQIEDDKPQERTLVQIQRDRLNRIKEEENRLRPMIRSTHGEDEIQRAIDQAQKEFDEAVATASAKLANRRGQ